MQIDILYTADDPGWEMVVDMVSQALGELDLDAAIHTCLVSSDREAHEEKFIGSPTIRADGYDLFPVEGAVSGLRLRSYWTEEGLLDMPTYEMLIDALGEYAESD